MPGALRIPGLALRHFAGPADYPGMVAVANAACLADAVQLVASGATGVVEASGFRIEKRNVVCRKPVAGRA